MLLCVFMHVYVCVSVLCINLDVRTSVLLLLLLQVAAALEAQLEDVFVPRPLPSLHANPLWMEEHPVAKQMAAKFKAAQAAEKASRAAAGGKKSMWE
jgi:hypothetical protein